MSDTRCGRKTRSGEPCRAFPVAGADVCRMHGGSAPQVRAAAARRLQRERLNGDLGRLLAELELDAAQRTPVEVLLDAVHRCWSMVSVLGALVGGLRSDGPAWAEADGDLGRLWGVDHLGDGATHVLVDEYGRWLERAARASKLAVDCGVAERSVQLAERLGTLVANTIRAVLTDHEVALTPAQREAASLSAVRHLRLVSGALDDGGT